MPMRPAPSSGAARHLLPLAGEGKIGGLPLAGEGKIGGLVVLLGVGFEAFEPTLRRRPGVVPTARTGWVPACPSPV
ncbi:hypothetical protein XAR_3031 [Xanthomonas citri pv. glycines str. 8ra]|nr:hypothetical protein XAR_3031 [Xanthomonas citri pv. glycines str. 8ra]